MYTACSYRTWGISLDRDPPPPRQRRLPPLDRDPPDRDRPFGQRPPFGQGPPLGQGPPPWTETTRTEIPPCEQNHRQV